MRFNRPVFIKGGGGLFLFIIGVVVGAPIGFFFAALLYARKDDEE